MALYEESKTIVCPLLSLYPNRREGTAMSRHIDKEALVAAVMSSTELDNEQKSQLIRLIREQKKYGLVWEDSKEDAWEKMKTSIPVLNEVDDKRILNDKDGEHYPNHAIIEADNLHALIALTYTHEGSFDMMYFDPPYNTGNGDFTYNDKIVDEEDSYRHSKWLSFMEKRLRIARRLLSERGVIFISIDDYSQAQLKVLCDSIFDSSSNPKHSNFITTLIWNKQHSQQQGLFKKYHEYVVVYAKNKSLLKNVLSEADGLIEAGAMKKISTKNPASTFAFPAGTKVEAPDGTTFSGTYGDSEKVTVVEGPFTVVNGQTAFPIVLSAGWTQKKQMSSWFKGLDTYDTKGQKIVEFYFNSTGKIKCRKERGAVTPNTFLPEFGMGSEQTSHLEDIMGKPDTFTNPKPVEMIKLFIEWFCPKNGKLLDIFAGSGTTLEATMQLNAEDGGHRQCILVTNNENNICEEVTYERNKRVIEGYTTPKGEQVAGLNHNNLRYYKLDFNPRKQSHQDNRELFYGLKDLLCIKENIYQEQQQFGSLSLVGKEQMLRYFAENGREMLMVYDTRVIPFIVSEIAQRDEQEQPLKIYIFADGAYPYTDDFASVVDKVSLIPMPYAYYRGIKDSLPEETTTKVDDTELTDEEQQTMMAEAIAFESKE